MLLSHSACLLPPWLCLNVCSLCGDLHCCPVDRFSSTIFLDSRDGSLVVNICCCCCCLVTKSCTTLCNCVDTMPGSSVPHDLPEFAQIHVHWVHKAIQPSHPLPLPSPFAFSLSKHQSLFQWVSSSHQVAKVLEPCFSISPSSEYSGLISFRIDWFGLFAVQGTLKSSAIPQFKSINSLVLSLL